MSTNVVEVHGVSRSYRKTLALDEISLGFCRGHVHGLVGVNGSGKTTLIKHILGLLKANTGSVRVFGMDPVLEPVNVLSKIGYLSEERDLPQWMRVYELLRYTKAYYPKWDDGYAAELLARFGLDGSKKISELSKGMRAQAGLIAAAAHHPDLLLLDEPSTGLDAVVRQDILYAILRAVADEGNTVVFSSHLLDEVEQMSDYITMIHEGKVILQGDVDWIKENHLQVALRFPNTDQVPDMISGLVAAERQQDTWLATYCGSSSEIRDNLNSAGAEILHARNTTLQETFIARVGRDVRAEEISS